VRQPLQRVRVALRDADEWEALEPFVGQILDELNVKGIERLDDNADVATYTLRPVTPILGPRLGARLPAVIKALNATNQNDAVARVRSGQPLSLAVGNEVIELAPHEVQVMAAGRPGFAVAEDEGYLLALDTTLTPDLVAEGLAREFVHRVQTMRRSAGFDIADRILIQWRADAALADVLDRYEAYITAETLSRRVGSSAGSDDYSETLEIDGHGVEVSLARDPAQPAHE
jgi:isoleucyl-tRNA synthetase